MPERNGTFLSRMIADVQAVSADPETWLQLGLVLAMAALAVGVG